jgi:hypothetical protein
MQPGFIPKDSVTIGVVTGIRMHNASAKTNRFVLQNEIKLWGGDLIDLVIF